MATHMFMIMPALMLMDMAAEIPMYMPVNTPTPIQIMPEHMPMFTPAHILIIQMSVSNLIFTNH